MAIAEQSGSNKPRHAGTERRKNPHLRDLFTHACNITTPLFDAHEIMGGFANLQIHANRTVHEAFPNLTAQDVALLVSGVTGFHLARLKKQSR